MCSDMGHVSPMFSSGLFAVALIHLPISGALIEVCLAQNV